MRERHTVCQGKINAIPEKRIKEQIMTCRGEECNCFIRGCQAKPFWRGGIWVKNSSIILPVRIMEAQKNKRKEKNCRSKPNRCAKEEHPGRGRSM